MKPNLTKRMTAAAAFVAIAAMVSACGSSSGSTVAAGYGAAIANGAGCTGMTQAVAFSGMAEMDSYGNIYAGESGLQMSLSATGAVANTGYEFGRVNSQDGSTLAFNLSGAYGSQMAIQGVYMMGQDVLGVLETMGGTMGYGYSYPSYGYGTTGYGSTGCGVSSLQIYEMGAEAMTQAASIIGEQPFTYALVSGELILNGSLNAPY